MQFPLKLHLSYFYRRRENSAAGGGMGVLSALSFRCWAGGWHRCPRLTKRGCEAEGTLRHCWQGCKMVQPLWQALWKFKKKLYIYLFPDTDSTPTYGTREMKAQKDVNQNDHGSWIHNSPQGKHPKCPLTGEWVNKGQNIPAMKYYSGIKRDPLLMYGTRRIGPHC